MSLNIIKKLFLSAVLFSSFIYTGTALAYNCTASIQFDRNSWDPQKEGYYAAFFVVHPGETLSNMITTYPHSGEVPTMKATFACEKLTYLEVHAVHLIWFDRKKQSLTQVEEAPLLMDPNNNLKATGKDWVYWSKCFGVIPDYQTGQDNVINFPALKGEDTNDKHYYSKTDPACLLEYQYSH